MENCGLGLTTELILCKYIREVLSEKVTFIRDLHKVGELKYRHPGVGQARRKTQKVQDCEMGEVEELRSSRASCS